MREITPTTRDIQRNYINHRRMADSVGYGYSLDEFDRWIAVHDQGIRDAVKPPTMTAREHLEAAWEAAYEVPEGQVIPKGTRYLLRISDHEVAAVEAGIDLREGPSARTLDPLPPVIPDDCDYVWASAPEDNGMRSIWVRMVGTRTRWQSRIPGVNCTVTLDQWSLIDPKPVPEEER